MPADVAADQAAEVEAVPRPRRRRGAIRRAQQRRRRRRRALLRTAATVGLLVGIATAVVVFAALRPDGDDAAGRAPEVRGSPDGGQSGDVDPQPTVVLATFDETDPSGGALVITVLAWDRQREQGTILLVPTSTVADVPGHGLLPLGRAFAFGQGPLLEASLDNLLGVDLDGVIAVSRQGWASLLSRIGGLTVEVPERLARRADDGSGEVRFRPGEQYLDGPRLAELMTFRQAGEQELAALPRVQLVLSALLDAVAADPALLDALFDDGAPMLDAPDPSHRSRLRDLLAELARDDELVVRTVPVEPIGAAEAGAYRLDRQRAAGLIRERLAASVPVGSTERGRTLQVLNGNGQPGIGQQVAARLLPRGFRVVLTGNANRFDYAETRILIYEDSEEQLAVAEEIRSVLGVGRIELSQVPQDVVDVTIIVGRDIDVGDG